MHYNIKIFKKSLLLGALILYISFAAANSADVVSDTGLVLLNIVNRPPVIRDIYLKPEIAFEDSKLECIVKVNDENADEIKFIYKWYLNSEVVETSNNYLEGFNENDVVRCEVTLVDNEGVFGETKSIAITINKKTAMNSITGFIVKNYKLNFHNIFKFLF